MGRSSSKKEDDYRPTIFSFETQEGHRLTLNIKERRINFSVTSGSNGSTTEDYTFSSTEIFKNRWFFMAFVYYPPRLLTTGEIRLYINGFLTERRAVRSGPRTTSGFQRNTVGCMWNENIKRDPHVFFGQIGNISFFDDTLNNIQIQSICSFGPNYFGSFQGSEWERNTVMNYSCSAQSGDYSLNNIPTSDDKGTKRATLKGVGSCRVCSLRDIIVCTEGVKVLFPLLLSLNKPPAPTTPEECKDDSKVLVSMMDLVHSVICGSHEMEDEVLKAHGYAALSRILKSIPARFMSPTFVSGFRAAYKALGHNVPMQNSLYVELLTDFFLWVFAPFQVQAELVNLLISIDLINDKKAVPVDESINGMKIIGNNEVMITGEAASSINHNENCSIDDVYDKKKAKEEKSNTNTNDGSSSGTGGAGNDGKDDNSSNDNSDNEESVDVRYCNYATNKHTALKIFQVLSIIRTFYWNAPTQPWCLGKEAPVSPHTGKPLGVRLSDKEAAKIREKLFSIVTQRIMAGKSTHKDVGAILGFLSPITTTNSTATATTTAGCADESQNAVIIGELLVALTKALNSQAATRFAKMFCERGGMSVLHGLVSALDEDLQVHAIDAIACFNRAIGNIGRTVKGNVLAASLQQSIMRRKGLTAKTYNSLIRMAVSMPPSTQEGGVMRLEYPEVLCFCILQLALSADLDVRRKVLQDLSTFLDQGIVNVLRVFECRGWQPPFCQFIMSFSKDADEEIIALATKVVANITIASVVGASTAGGWWNIGYFLRLLSDFGLPNAAGYYRIIRLNSAVRFAQVAQKLITASSFHIFANTTTTEDSDPSEGEESSLPIQQDGEGNPLSKKTSIEAQVLVGIILSEYDFLVQTLPDITCIQPLLSQSVESLIVTKAPPLKEEASQWARREASLLIEILTCFADLNILTLPNWGNAHESDNVVPPSRSNTSSQLTSTQDPNNEGNNNKNNVGPGSAGTNLRTNGAIGVSVLAAERILQIAGRVGTDCTAEVYGALNNMTAIVDAQLSSNKGSPTPAFCFILLSTVRIGLESYKNNYTAIAKEELEFVHKLLTKAHWKRSGFLKRKSVISKDNVALVTEMCKTSLATPSADPEAAVAALESKEWSLVTEELRPLAEDFIHSAREEENAMNAHNDKVKIAALNFWKDSTSDDQNYILSSQNCIKTDVSRIVEQERKHITKIHTKLVEKNINSAVNNQIKTYLTINLF